MIKTVDELFALVSKTRNAQRLYFRYRSSQNLNDAKLLEKQVDQEIEQWEKQQYERSQPELGM